MYGIVILTNLFSSRMMKVNKRLLHYTIMNNGPCIPLGDFTEERTTHYVPTVNCDKEQK